MTTRTLDACRVLLAEVESEIGKVERLLAALVVVQKLYREKVRKP